MDQLPVQPRPGRDPQVEALEKEIETLENELKAAEQAVNGFEFKIRSQLQAQIQRILELNGLYKSRKQAKKAKRLEQKKRGKHYKEPRGLARPAISEAVPEGSPGREELKRLYREAIVQVHPDKFGGEEAKANDLTVKLNALYKSGNLEAMLAFHEHILGGFALAHEAYRPAGVPDGGAALKYLQNKKREMAASLEQIRRSPVYEALTTYAEPADFIEELRQQFEQRISVLEKRTRK